MLHKEEIKDWVTIDQFPYKDKRSYLQYILCNKDQGWIRFGIWYREQKEWYYSGTNERCQWSMRDSKDTPTHFMSIPKLPKD